VRVTRSSFIRKILLKDKHICPWWLAYTFDNPVRRLFHKPETIFNDYLAQGMTALDIGCGMGYFSIGMAEIVGAGGRVISVDIQQQMLDVVLSRARKAGVAERIQLHKCEDDTIGLSVQADFVLTFWMAHEVPDIRRFMEEIYALLKPKGKYLLAEPLIHIGASRFEEISAFVLQSGFHVTDQPAIAMSRACVFEKD
jgi:ubiquinone/menaquinone biosynthesis C-methylase UbiE